MFLLHVSWLIVTKNHKVFHIFVTKKDFSIWVAEKSNSSVFQVP